MAIYHMSAQIVKRSEGRNSVAMSAYRAGQSLIDEATALVKDYTSKTKVYLAEILTPQNAPKWMQDRQSLWNGVEKKENRKDAQLAREINIALPKELNYLAKYELATKYIKDNFVSAGMVADVAYHNLETDNPHCHIMLTTRTIDADGFGKKERSWNDKNLLKSWRQSWASYANRALAKAGIRDRIDHRTLDAQGIDRESQIHVGPTGNSKDGSIRSRRNDEIIARNAQREQLKTELKKLEKELHDEQVLERGRNAKNHQRQCNKGLSLSDLRKESLVDRKSITRLSDKSVLFDLKRDDRQQDTPLQQPRRGVERQRVVDKPKIGFFDKLKSRIFGEKDNFENLVVPPPRRITSPPVPATAIIESAASMAEVPGTKIVEFDRSIAKNALIKTLVPRFACTRGHLVISDAFKREYSDELRNARKQRDAEQKSESLQLRSSAVAIDDKYTVVTVVAQKNKIDNEIDKDIEIIAESLSPAYFETYVCDDIEHAKNLILDDLDSFESREEKLNRLDDIANECGGADLDLRTR